MELRHLPYFHYRSATFFPWSGWQCPHGYSFSNRVVASALGGIEGCHHGTSLEVRRITSFLLSQRTERDLLGASQSELARAIWFWSRRRVSNGCRGKQIRACLGRAISDGNVKPRSCRLRKPSSKSQRSLLHAPVPVLGESGCLVTWTCAMPVGGQFFTLVERVA
jgi:hypothetical protein